MRKQVKEALETWWYDRRVPEKLTPQTLFAVIGKDTDSYYHRNIEHQLLRRRGIGRKGYTEILAWAGYFDSPLRYADMERCINEQFEEIAELENKNTLLSKTLAELKNEVKNSADYKYKNAYIKLRKRVDVIAQDLGQGLLNRLECEKQLEVK